MKWLLTLALLFVGCSNPCDDYMSKNEQEEWVNTFRIWITLQEAGLGVNPLVTIILANIETNDECFDFLADQVR